MKRSQTGKMGKEKGMMKGNRREKGMNKEDWREKGMSKEDGREKGMSKDDGREKGLREIGREGERNRVKRTGGRKE